MRFYTCLSSVQASKEFSGTKRRICSFRGFCDRQWENKTLQSFEDKERYAK